LSALTAIHVWCALVAFDADAFSNPDAGAEIGWVGRSRRGDPNR
jgi:hypothetical protein